MKTFNHVSIEIVNDDYAENPRDAWDNMSTFVYPQNPHWIMGGKKDIGVDRYDGIESIEEMKTRLIKEGAIVKEYSNQAYNCFAYVERETILKEYRIKRISKKILEYVNSNLDGEIETFQNWANGEVYGYIVTNNETGETLDSCYGFYGEKDVKEEAESNAKLYEEKIQAEIDKINERLEEIAQ